MAKEDLTSKRFLSEEILSETVAMPPLPSLTQRTLKLFEESFLKHLASREMITKAQRLEAVKARIKKSANAIDFVLDSGALDEAVAAEAIAELSGARRHEEHETALLGDLLTLNIFEASGFVLLRKEKSELTVASYRPLLVEDIQKIREVGPFTVNAAVVTRSWYRRVREELELLLENRQKSTLLSDAELATLPEGEKAVLFVDQIVQKAILLGASDIHIEPFKERFRIRMRIDGMLHAFGEYDNAFHTAVASRFKLLADLDIAEKREPQDGAFVYKDEEGRETGFRASAIPTIYGEKLVLRKLSDGSENIELESLGMEGTLRVSWERLIHAPHGIVLVCGPTGSGKSTTLSATISRINIESINISTVEDPVEYKIAGVNQVQVDDVKISFADALRSLLRQDPDVVMVGEVRDKETAEIALRASLTGHLVFSTIHTNNAPSAVTRLVDMGTEPFLVASSINGVLAQRLVRRCCAACKQARPAEAFEKLLLGAGEDEEVTLYEGSGCPHCNFTGYKGRVGIYELLVVDSTVRRMILEQSNDLEIGAYAKAECGMQTLSQHAAQKVREGVTTVEEFQRVVGDE
jgi:type II secretory ATPase GspE/PulE/Tfp pilus assembly ATPase PilB-like protein